MIYINSFSKKISSVNSQTVFNLLSQIFLNGTNFILIMWFTRLLSTSDYGIVSIYQAYVSFFSVIIGLNVQASISPAFIRIERKDYDNYLSSIMLISLISFFVIFILSSMLMKNLSDFSQLSPLLIRVMIIHSFSIFVFNFASIKYTYLKQAQWICFMSFIIAVIMIFMALFNSKIVGKNSQPYMGRILGLAVPYILCALFLIIGIYAKGKPFCNIKEYWHFCIPICLPLVFHGISQIILAQTDKIMLQKILDNNSAVGVYSFVVTFVHILNCIYTALNNTWVPIYYDYTKKEELISIEYRSKRYNKLFTVLVTGFILVAPEFIKFLADQKYWNGILLIPVIAITQYMVYLYSFPVNYEFYNRKTKWIAVGTTGAAICNIILNILFIPKLDMLGAAIATLVSYIILFLFHQLCARKIDNKYPFKIKFFVKNLFLVLIICFIFYVLIKHWVIRWILAFIIGIFELNDIIKYKSVF